jgi:hypothetical protein
LPDTSLVNRSRRVSGFGVGFGGVVFVVMASPL